MLPPQEKRQKYQNKDQSQEEIFPCNSYYQTFFIESFSFILKSHNPKNVSAPLTISNVKPKSKSKYFLQSELIRRQSSGAATAIKGAALSIILYFVKIPKKKSPNSGP